MKKAIHKKPGEEPTVVEVKDGIDHLQELVGGGLFERVYHPILEERGITLYANEEGLFRDFEPNLIVYGQPIVGPVICVGHNDEGERVALTAKQAAIATIFLDKVAIHSPDRRAEIHERIRAML